MKRALPAVAFLLLAAQAAVAAPIVRQLPVTFPTRLSPGLVYTFVLGLYDGPGEDADRLWQEGPVSIKVQPDKTITHLLGSQRPFSDRVDFSQQLWVQWTGGGETRRVRLGVVPYAMHSLGAESRGADGLSCWDLDGSGTCDIATEDVDGSGVCDAADCRGPQGDKGDAGDTGPAGPAGAQGEQGPQGIAGNLALAGKLCPGNSVLRGFDGEGNLVCTPLSNYPPVLAPIGDKQAAAGALVEFTVEATDLNGDPLTYSATGLPDGATFSTADRLFSWTPAANQVGPHTVTFSVSDGAESDSEAVSILVADPVSPACGGCHGDGGQVHSGVDGTPNTADDAPNVMTVNVGGAWVSVWDGGWWDSQQGGNAATQQGGHGDPDGKEEGNASLTPACVSCHDISLPPGTHLDGVYNSLGSENAVPDNPSTPRAKGNQNANTAHLVQEYFTRYPANGAGAWGVQVAVDNYCALACHAANSVPDMRHEQDTLQSDPNHGSVEFGTHYTYATPAGSILDVDLTTDAAGLPNFAPCVSCHNPHGSANTDVVSAGPAARNKMLVKDWYRATTLCKDCHL